MAYDYPFQLLNSEADIPLLTSSKEATFAYIDCLALLQGLILPLSTYLNCQQFDDVELARETIEQLLSKIPPSIVETIKKNQETAFDILNEAQQGASVKRGVSVGQITTAANNFLDGLIIQYSILRQADFEEEPLEMSAGGF